MSFLLPDLSKSFKHAEYRKLKSIQVGLLKSADKMANMAKMTNLAKIQRRSPKGPLFKVAILVKKANIVRIKN